MSIILFFGLAILITLVGIIYSALVVHHHWKLSRKPAEPVEKQALR